MDYDPESVGFHTHAIDCRCLGCLARRADARSKPTYTNDPEHTPNVATPEHAGIFIDGHRVHVGEDWSDD